MRKVRLKKNNIYVIRVHERAMEILKEELGDMAEQIYTGFEIEV